MKINIEEMSAGNSSSRKFATSIAKRGGNEPRGIVNNELRKNERSSKPFGRDEKAREKRARFCKIGRRRAHLRDNYQKKVAERKRERRKRRKRVTSREQSYCSRNRRNRDRK